MVETGWSGVPDELPASEHLRSVAEILSAPPSTREQRDAERREQREAEARRDRVADAADRAAADAFMMRFNGRERTDPLADARREPFRDTEALTRRRAAINVLKQHGLADVITGGQSGVIFDPNIGVLEPVLDERARSARASMDRQYEFERSQRDAEERSRFIGGLRDSLRARGLWRQSSRSAGRDASSTHPAACNCLPCNGGDAAAQARNALAEIGQLSYR